MAFQVFEGTYTPSAGTGNESVTGVGFQPKAVIFFSDNNNNVDSYGQHCYVGIGFATDSTHQATVSFFSQDSQTTTSTQRLYRNDRCLDIVDSPSLSFVSMDSDGFTVNRTVSNANILISYLALGGSDLTNAIVKEITKDSLTTGNEAYTGFGFQPGAVLVIGNLLTTSGVATTPGKLSIGAAISTSARWALAINARTGQTMTANVDAMRTQRSQLCLGLTDTATIDCVGDLASFDSDGLTINWSDVPATDNTLWSVLALKGGQYACGVNAKPTGAATANQDITLGFTPVGIFLQSFGIAATDTITADAEFSVGASDGTHEDAVWVEARDATIATESNRVNINGKALRLATGTSTTDAECDADFSSVTNGVRLAWTINNGTAASIAYLAFGSSAVSFDPATIAGLLRPHPGPYESIGRPKVSAY